ncbi:hypothetical protein MHYP_G00277570 [Metynnis hypsauchen]
MQHPQLPNKQPQWRQEALGRPARINTMAFLTEAPPWTLLRAAQRGNFHSANCPCTTAGKSIPFSSPPWQPFLHTS